MYTKVFHPGSRYPRAQFRMDLQQLLKQFMDQQHIILLMGEFNEDFEGRLTHQ
jgi:hypothetical protein